MKMVIPVLGVLLLCAGHWACQGRHTSLTDTARDVVVSSSDLSDAVGAHAAPESISWPDGGPKVDLGAMVQSYMECEEAYEDDWYPHGCCVLKEDRWVYHSNPCQHGFPVCDCGIGFEPTLVGDFDCNGFACVPSYPASCQPKQLLPVEDSGEVGPPPEAPFLCLIETAGGPVAYYTDCPCPMLEGVVSPWCGCGQEYLFANCVTQEDCAFGWCVPHDGSWTGNLCGPLCLEDCPQGWTCAMARRGPDVLFTCFPYWLNLCRPCVADEECGHELDSAARCVDFGVEGRFCGAGCKWSDPECPDGYACTELDLGEEEPVSLCLPTSGLCECQPRFIAMGAATTCPVENEFGICTGERMCTLDGLTDCAGPGAAPETCDGVDNDCDGETDEEWPVGIPCDGPDPDECATTVWTCVPDLSGVECIDKPLSDEVCDGVDNNCDGETDEGFPDFDLDDVSDCVDPDDDDDGDLDVDDCEPLNPMVGPGLKEICFNGLDDDCDGIQDPDDSCADYQNAECAGGTCTCTPDDCADKECGPDGCGGSCGDCVEDAVCYAGNCLETVLIVDIPGGVFHMGCNEDVDDECQPDEYPYHEVFLPPYQIDMTEVTVGAYGACVEDGACTPPETGAPVCNWYSELKQEHPMNCVVWAQAQTFCNWVGGRLCTEAEWEKAARGTEGVKYPWGNEELSCDFAVHGNGCGEGTTWPVGSKPAGASPYGLLDMLGNVAEWTADWYGNGYYDQSPSDNPQGPEYGFKRVVRGGAYLTSNCRASDRLNSPATNLSVSRGIRCCRSPAE